MSRLTIAAVAAALVLASAGGAVGATVITSAQIKDGTIRAVDLANGAVNGIKVENGSLTGADIEESSLGPVPSAASLEGKRIVEGRKVYTGSTNLLSFGGLVVGSYGLVDPVGVCEPQISVTTSVPGASALIVRQGGGDGSTNARTLYFERSMSVGTWRRIDGINTVGTASIHFAVGDKVVEANVSWYPLTDGSCLAFVSAYGG